MEKIMNREPPIGHYGNFGEWVITKNVEPITNDMVENFFIQIFRQLEINEMCFSSGAFVFENYGNVLFNLLTFNKLLIENNSYYCNNPLNPIQPLTPANVHIIATETHDVYYKKYGRGAPIEIKPGKCMPATNMYSSTFNLNRNKTKFERIFNPSINNICGHCEVPAEIERSEPKGVVLYYPFYVTSNVYPIDNPKENIDALLYVKFEGFSVTENKVKHALEYVKKTLGKKKKYAIVDTRREDKCDYNTTFRNKDIEFYRKYCPEDIEILEWYNMYIRAGCEFFVSKGLLIYFLESFLFSKFDCNSAASEDSQNKIFELEENKKMGVGGKIKLRKTRRNTKSRKTIKKRHVSTNKSYRKDKIKKIKLETM
jgi:hypothetical protein